MGGQVGTHRSSPENNELTVCKASLLLLSGPLLPLSSLISHPPVLTSVPHRTPSFFCCTIQPFDFTEANHEQVDIILSKYPENYKASGIIPLLGELTRLVRVRVKGVDG